MSIENKLSSVEILSYPFTLDAHGKSVESKLVSIEILTCILISLKGTSHPVGREVATEKRNLDPLAGRS